MSTKDPRVIRTFKLISETLIEMASEIGYELVQVSDLVIKAGISKSTFYRHFLDKDSLLKYVISDILQTVIKRMASGRSELEEAILCFRYVRDHPRHARLCLNLPLNSPLRQMIRAAFTQTVLARYRPLNQDPQLEDMAINHILASTDALLEWYLDNLDTCSPEEVAQMYLDVIVRAAVGVAIEPREERLPRSE